MHDHSTLELKKKVQMFLQLHTHQQPPVYPLQEFFWKEFYLLNNEINILQNMPWPINWVS